MKVDKYVKDIANRIAVISSYGNGGNGNGHNKGELIIFEDDYYLDRGDFPLSRAK
ncbi:MAG TPA: hypothetical protein VI278_03400 [Nitrososphaeraceae archaeon]